MSEASLAEKPIVIAHRGASGYVAEHTLLAVTLAHGMGADFIEQDLVLSRDGVPVVLHDIHLESTTDVETRFPGRQRQDGRFYAIDFDLAELKRLRVGERRGTDGNPVFPGRFPETGLPLRIPTLAEEIELITGLNRSRKHQAGLYIEMKSPGFHRREGQDIARATLEVLERYDLNIEGKPVYLQCFDDATLRYLREELGTPLPLIMLIADNAWGENDAVDYDALRTREGLATLAPYIDGIGPWLPQLFEVDLTTPSTLVQIAHDLGLLVHPYTLRADALPLGADSFEALQHKVFIDAGVDGAFSDFPDLTRSFIDQHVASGHPVSNGDATP